jgi:hypothetical protein
MEEKIKIIFRKNDGKLAAFLISENKESSDDQLLATCSDCLLEKFKVCCHIKGDYSVNSEIYFSQEKNKFFKKVRERDILCDDYLFGNYYNFRSYEEIEIPESFLVKSFDANYGDEDDLAGESDGIISLSPAELINTFCKKVCPGYKENLLCMKDLGCPFHDFMNECYKIIEK